ncbi:hypothetical protein T02_13700, partial [Trichinella nativa]
LERLFKSRRRIRRPETFKNLVFQFSVMQSILSVFVDLRGRHIQPVHQIFHQAEVVVCDGQMQRTLLQFQCLKKRHYSQRGCNVHWSPKRMFFDQGD